MPVTNTSPKPFDFTKVCVNVISSKPFIKGDGSEASLSDPVDTVCLSDVNKDGRVNWTDASQFYKSMPKLTPRQLVEREKFQKEERWQKMTDDYWAQQAYDQSLENLGLK